MDFVLLPKINSEANTRLGYSEIIFTDGNDFCAF